MTDDDSAKDDDGDDENVDDIADIADGITVAGAGASQAAATAVQARIQLLGASIRRCRVYCRGFSSSCFLL